jgi:hypothetical protein
VKDLALEHKQLYPAELSISFSAKECYNMFNRWKRDNCPSYEMSSLSFGKQFARLKLNGVTCLKDEQRTKTFEWQAI